MHSSARRSYAVPIIWRFSTSVSNTTQKTAPLKTNHRNNNWTSISPNGLGDEDGELVVAEKAAIVAADVGIEAEDGPTPPRLDCEPFGSRVMRGIHWRVGLCLCSTVLE